jgi:Endomembrane protein 70
MVALWALVTFPLTVAGALAGRARSGEFAAPCRTTKLPRAVPPMPWYRGAAPQMALAGFLPFSAIYIELYYIFASIWGHKLYTIYSILFIVFVILVIVTAFITVALTYFQVCEGAEGLMVLVVGHSARPSCTHVCGCAASLQCICGCTALGAATHTAHCRRRHLTVCSLHRHHHTTTTSSPPAGVGGSSLVVAFIHVWWLDCLLHGWLLRLLLPL